MTVYNLASWDSLPTLTRCSRLRVCLFWDLCSAKNVCSSSFVCNLQFQKKPKLVQNSNGFCLLCVLTLSFVYFIVKYCSETLIISLVLTAKTVWGAVLCFFRPIVVISIGFHFSLWAPFWAPWGVFWGAPAGIRVAPGVLCGALGRSWGALGRSATAANVGVSIIFYLHVCF